MPKHSQSFDGHDTHVLRDQTFQPSAKVTKDFNANQTRTVSGDMGRRVSESGG